jgi:GPH family glycoside/pentoside/hexuronide:cation symporter
MKKLKPISKIGYGVGDLANGLTFGMSATFLLAFYTDVLGITAAAAGTLFLVARIWDAVNDPMMGTLADRMFARRMAKHRASGTKVDKFRPYLLKGSWPVAVAAILMFVAPNGMSMTGKLIWAYATYITWGMTYTFINIPYGSLAAVMTQDPVERSSLSIFRGLGGLFGAMFGRVLVPMLLVQFADDQARGYLLAMIIFGVITVAGYIFSYFTVKETVETKIEENQKFSLKDSLSIIVKNRPFLAISLASIAMLTGLLVQGSMQIYYFRENMDALHLMGATAVLQLLPMLLVMPIIPILVKKFGTKSMVSWSSLLSAAVLTILMFLPSNVWIYLGGMFIAMLGLMVPNMVTWGMVSDTIDYNQYLSGVRQEGAIYGMYSFVRKMGQAFAGFLAGVGLQLVGYVANSPTQTAGTLFGIKFLSIGLPAIGMFIAFIAFAFVWNLTPEKQAEVTAAIAKDPQNPEDDIDPAGAVEAITEGV